MTRRAIEQAGFEVVSSDEIISDLGAVSARIMSIKDDLARATAKRDTLIVSAVKMSIPRDRISLAADVSRQRVHSIAQSHRNR